MAIENIKLTIQGKSALLMNKFPMEPITALEKKTKEEKAEYAAYRIPDAQELYIPAVAIQRGLIAAAVYSKGKGRASLQKPVAACVLINPEYISLGVEDYIIDARPVVVPATKGRIMRYRPRIEEWTASFELEYDSDLLTAVQMRQVVDDCGTRVGILDFRPENKGPFGRFFVTNWKTVS